MQGLLFHKLDGPCTVSLLSPFLVPVESSQTGHAWPQRFAMRLDMFDTIIRRRINQRRDVVRFHSFRHMQNLSGGTRRRPKPTRCLNERAFPCENVRVGKVFGLLEALGAEQDEVAFNAANDLISMGRGPNQNIVPSPSVFLIMKCFTI
jgi:hypothetical protein